MEEVESVSTQLMLGRVRLRLEFDVISMGVESVGMGGGRIPRCRHGSKYMDWKLSAVWLTL